MHNFFLPERSQVTRTINKKFISFRRAMLKLHISFNAATAIAAIGEKKLLMNFSDSVTRHVKANIHLQAPLGLEITHQCDLLVVVK